MSGNNNLKYEVAISFLADDENLASSIAQKLKEQVSVFIYPEQQKELAGKDGVEIFFSLFRREARVVVVLYREGWGETKWTRVEETAIKERTWDEGWNFLIVIALEPPKIPVWIPNTIMWFDLDTFGMDEAVGVIKARVIETGGTIHEETFLEKADRFNLELESIKKRKEFLNSKKGYDAANDQARNLFKIFNEAVNALITETGIQFFIEGDFTKFKIRSHGVRLEIQWDLIYSNTLNDSALHISLLDIDRGRDGFSGSPKYKELKSSILNFDIDDSEQHGWRESKGEKKFYTSEKLINIWLKNTLEFVQKIRIKNV